MRGTPVSLSKNDKPETHTWSLPPVPEPSLEYVNVSTCSPGCNSSNSSDEAVPEQTEVLPSSTTVNFNGGTVEAGALVGRMVTIGSNTVQVTANTTSQMTVEKAISASTNDVIYPGEGGKDGRDVYSTLILGADAYGVTELEGGGLQHIVKQLGSSGTADPLNQRATAGWKLTKVAERLVEQYMVRIESASTFESGSMN